MFRDLRVVDLSSGIAGPYATKLLADAGAEVVKVEPPEGDPLRSHALFDFLNTSKRSLVGRLGDDRVDALVAEADVLVEDHGPGAVDPVPLHDRNPGLTVVSISPFGGDGPWAERPATEFTLQAWCGSIGSRGTPDRPPLAAGGRIGEWVTGSFAAVAAVSGWRAARVSGRGDHVDVSMLECMSVSMNTFASLFTRFLGMDAPVAPMPTVELPSIEPTKDGFVGFCTIPRQQFQDFLVLIERPDLLADEGLANVHVRTQRMAEFLEIVHTWTTQHTTDEIIELASAMRIPVAPILDGATVVEHEHFVARGAFVENPHGFTQPRVPYRIGDIPRPAFRPLEDFVAFEARGAPEPSVPQERTGEDVLPLEGIRVIDATAFWAGPSATQVLAALGADVIKLESVQRPDGMRFTSTQPPSVDQWWEWGPVFHGANAGKRSVTLDLNRPEGLALAKRLIGEADALVENFSPRVMDNFGLDWDTVHATNPDLVMVRMPAFGLDGPWRDRTGFAQTMEQMTGMAAVTGFPDGPPLIPRGPCDPLAGLHAVLAFLAALEERERTGEGMLVEVTMAEAALNAAAEPVVEYSATGNLIGRMGNAGRTADPQGVFAGPSGTWVALAAETDDQRAALEALLDGSTVDEWCAAAPAPDRVDALLAAGVPAGVVIHAAAIDENEQLNARSFYERLEHPVTGTQPLPSIPIRFARRGFRWHRSPPPTLGQHNDEVLGGLLGLDEDERARLREAAIIGDRPAGV